MCLLRIANVTSANTKTVNANLVWEKIGNLCIELFTVNRAVQVWKHECDNFKMCMHSHFHPSPGYWFKMVAAWMYYRRPCNLPLRWRLPRTKGGREERGPQTTSWECEIVDNYLLSKIQCLPDELELNLQKPQQLPQQNATEKSSVWICVCMCVHVCVQACCSVSISLPLLTRSHVHSDTNERLNYN